MESQVQVYLQKLRVKELHAILRRLGLSTQGLKSQLVKKIEAYLREHSDTSVRSVNKRAEASKIHYTQVIYCNGGTRLPVSYV